MQQTLTQGSQTYSFRLAQADARPSLAPNTEGLRTYNSDSNGVVSVDSNGSPVTSGTIYFIFGVVLVVIIVAALILRRRRPEVANL